MHPQRLNRLVGYYLTDIFSVHNGFSSRHPRISAPADINFPTSHGTCFFGMAIQQDSNLRLASSIQAFKTNSSIGLPTPRKSSLARSATPSFSGARIDPLPLRPNNDVCFVLSTLQRVRRRPFSIGLSGACFYSETFFPY